MSIGKITMSFRIQPRNFDPPSSRDQRFQDFSFFAVSLVLIGKHPTNGQPLIRRQSI